MSILLALALQVGPNPLGGAMPNDDLVRDRPPRADAVAAPEAETETEAEAPLNATSAWLQGCLSQLEEDPARAHAMAQIRRAETTGTDRVLANHCLGTASAKLGLWDDARTAFAAARAETPAAEPRTRARFGALAGNAALAGGDAGTAERLLIEAEGDARTGRATLLEAIAATDRARALVMLGRSDDAFAALENATTLVPERAEGWLLKATLLRRMERLPGAQTAIERAATLAPANPAVGLEAGVIAVLGGRDAAARASWQSVIDLAPGTPEAAAATGYLAQLAPAPDIAGPTPEETPPP